MDKKKVGNFLRSLRTERNLTQESMVEEFSNFLGFDGDAITVTTVSKWERGEVFPNIVNIKDLSRFYDVTIDEIFNGERERIEEFAEKYFICDNDWAKRNYPKDVNLWDVWGEQALKIEIRFNELLKKSRKHINRSI